MNLEHSQILIGQQPPQQAATSLRGTWLTLARVACGVLVLFTLCIFIASLFQSFMLLHIPCPTPTCTATTGQLTAKDIHTLQQFGLSLDNYVFYWLALNILVTLGWFGIAGILVWRKSDDWLVLLVVLMLVCAGATTLVDVQVFSTFGWRLIASGWYMLNALVLLFTFALFPDGRFVPRWIALIPFIYPAQYVFYLLFLRPLHLPGWSLDNNPLNAVAWFGSFAVLAFAQLYRYLRISNQIERQQTKWVAFSFLVLLIADFCNTAVSNLLSIQQIGLFYVLIVSIFTCIFLCVPLAFGIAILRYRLWDIDILIRRTLVYGILTTCIIGMYVLVVGYLGALFHTESNLGISLLATGLVAVLFQPLREVLQRSINRLLYGQRDEPYRVISRLGQRLEATLAPDAILTAIVETVAQSLKLPYVAIALKHGENFAIAASYSAQSSKLSAAESKNVLHLPLLYQSEQVGELLLAPRTRDEPFTPADHRLLNDLARQAGIAAHAVSLTADLKRLTLDLQRSRERLVTAREEERRRLRRDLHDGLGPQLASLTLKLETAHNKLAHDPLADTLLSDLTARTQQAVADIRRLVYALRPPALDELGLVRALHEQALQYEGQHLSIIVEAPHTLPPLPAAVEVAVFRIAQEALTNVVRHAHASQCLIRLELERASETLMLEVQDNGQGLSPKHDVGVGLHSMRERAEELGGTWAIEPLSAGGTRVEAQLPCGLVKQQTDRTDIFSQTTYVEEQ